MSGTLLAAKNSLSLGQFTVDTTTTGEKQVVPGGMRPNIGPLASLNYKTGEVRYHISGSGALVGSLELRAGTSVLGTASISGDGDGRFVPDLAVLQGQERLELVLDVTTAGNAGALVQSVLDVEQPLVLS